MQHLHKKLQARRKFVNPIFKDVFTVFRTSEETGGSYVLGQLEVFPGGGNPLHIHSQFTETFSVVKGVLGVRYGDRKLIMQPGESITIPIGTPHHFFNDSNEPVVCHLKLEPGHDGFAKGIAIVYGLSADGMTNEKGVPKSFSHLALVMKLTDARLVGTSGVLMPLFSWLAKRARKNGMEKELLEKYYYESI